MSDYWKKLEREDNSGCKFSHVSWIDDATRKIGEHCPYAKSTIFFFFFFFFQGSPTTLP